MAETGKMIFDGAHINIKKNRAKTATLWKTGESGTVREDGKKKRDFYVKTESK